MGESFNKLGIKRDYILYEFFRKNFTKPISGLVRFILILSPRESQNFRYARNL